MSYWQVLSLHLADTFVIVLVNIGSAVTAGFILHRAIKNGNGKH